MTATGTVGGTKMSVTNGPETPNHLKTRVTENVKRVADLSRGDRCRFFTEDSFKTVSRVTKTGDQATLTFEPRGEGFGSLVLDKDLSCLVEVAV